jgi:hypothetical protein
LRGQPVAEVAPSYRLHGRGDRNCNLLINGYVRYCIAVHTNTRRTDCCLIVAYFTSVATKVVASETRFCDMCLAIILVYKFTECSRLVLEVHTWNLICKKVKYTLVQTLRLCTVQAAHRGSRGIALLFHDHGTRKG